MVDQTVRQTFVERTQETLIAVNFRLLRVQTLPQLLNLGLLKLGRVCQCQQVSQVDHVTDERGLSHCLSKCRGDASGSKLENDTADRSQIIAVKLGTQSNEQRHLFGVEGLAVG